ncbi:hypothetical protein ACHAXR_008833 [Thalassiosira sp. AJA248-18]
MPPPRRQLNPAFAKAHDLAIPEDGRKKRQPPSSSTSRNDNKISSKKKVNAALRSARSTARLNLSSCSLNVASLPDGMFDLRHNIEIDLSMDSSANPSSWQSYGEEEVTILDISDNDNACGKESLQLKLDDRLVKFVSLRTLRAKRSNIGQIPWTSVISKMDNLVKLDVSGNDLTEAMLEYLPMTMREVDLSNNNLVRLTEMFEDGANNANIIEPVIVLPNLKNLNVSNNKLSKLPKSMEVPNLQTFCFGNNHITDISSSVTDIIMQCAKSLSTLEGSHNHLRTVPDLSHCKKLTTVDLGDNSLTEVPSIHPSVVCLNVNNNALTSIGGLFGSDQLDSNAFRSNLNELQLRGNKICDLDVDIVRCLTNAIMIDAGQNDLKDVPHVLGCLPHLRRLPLDGNPIRVIRTPLLTDTRALKVFLRKRGPAPRGPGYMDEEPDRHSASSEGNRVTSSSTALPTNNHAKSLVRSALTGAFTLDVSGKRLDALPVEIGKELLLSNDATAINRDGDDVSNVGGRIKKLNVSKNSLNNLDEWLSAMPNLSSVDASQNQIKSLHYKICDIPIVELRIARNRLSSMAMASTVTRCVGEASLSSFATSLTSIDLSGNCLEWLPSIFSKLPVLSTLIVANNNIATLEMGTEEGGIESGWPSVGFKSLETLNLSNNKISNLAEMPQCLIACCPLLRSMSLANNELSVIPPALGVLQSLMSIDLRGNPQHRIRPDVLDRNAADILSYLRSRLDEKELRLLEAKLATAGPLGSNNNSSSSSEGVSSNEGNAKVAELRKNIDDITLQLNNVHLTEAKKYALKKTMKMNKAALIKEERRIRMEAGKS